MILVALFLFNSGKYLHGKHAIQDFILDIDTQYNRVRIYDEFLNSSACNSARTLKVGGTIPQPPMHDEKLEVWFDYTHLVGDEVYGYEEFTGTKTLCYDVEAVGYSLDYWTDDSGFKEGGYINGDTIVWELTNWVGDDGTTPNEIVAVGARSARLLCHDRADCFPRRRRTGAALLETRAEGEWWANMEELFHTD